MRVFRFINICIILLLTVGFRWMAGYSWDVSIEQPTLWIELDEEFFSSDGFSDKLDDLKSNLASLKNLPEDQHRAEIWRIILADYASVDTSFLRLRLKPGQIASIDSTHTDVYDETYAKSRTIKIVVGQSLGAGGGFASLETEENTIVGCKITISPKTIGDPNFLTHILVHEIMHCIGFEHQQDDPDSIMSYSSKRTDLSLEERMAITMLYPLKSEYAKESPTFGLACAPAK
jgi:hypothetical protein